MSLEEEGMEYLHRNLFSNDTLSSDELDELFDQLEQLEPPFALITAILSAISQLPPLTGSIVPDALDAPVVQCNLADLSP